MLAQLIQENRKCCEFDCNRNVYDLCDDMCILCGVHKCRTSGCNNECIGNGNPDCVVCHTRGVSQYEHHEFKIPQNPYKPDNQHKPYSLRRFMNQSYEQHQCYVISQQKKREQNLRQFFTQPKYVPCSQKPEMIKCKKCENPIRQNLLDIDVSENALLCKDCIEVEKQKKAQQTIQCDKCKQEINQDFIEECIGNCDSFKINSLLCQKCFNDYLEKLIPETKPKRICTTCSHEIDDAFISQLEQEHPEAPIIDICENCFVQIINRITEK